MESILLDEDLQSLWPRGHDSQDFKKKQLLPSTPTMSSSHDPMFSPPLKRKKDPLPTLDRSNKSQRMTDHLTARLATTLHVSSSMDTVNPTNNHQTGLSSRGFYRVQEQTNLHPHEQEDWDQPPQDTTGNTSSEPEPRKYRRAVRNRSNPTTPIHSHPPSPGTLPNTGSDDLFSSFSSSSSPFPSSPSLSRLALESFTRNTASPTLFLDPKRSGRPSSLLMRRESRLSQQSLQSPAHQHLAMSTRLAVFHRIHSTTVSASAQTIDKDVWIMDQLSKRDIQDRQSFEAAITQHAQVLIAAMESLGDGFLKRTRHSFSSLPTQSQDQEIAVYNTIQTTADAILEHAQWLCGPDFEMGINRICPQWSLHEGTIEQIVRYVQFVESMRETLSGRFQHPQELSEDLERCQEIIDYQKTLFGETLRNNGLEWRALGLPAMDELIHRTQDWILNLAKLLTIKIRAEVNFALENASHHRTTADPSRMDMMDDDDEISTIGRSVSDVMDFVLQGALLSRSCLELAGKRCSALVTAWMELASQYCTYVLAKRKEHVARANKAPTSQIRKLINAGNMTGGAGLRKLHQAPQHTHSGVRRGVFLKTMELFENIGSLLQCVMEIREEEEHDGHGLGIFGYGFNSHGDHEDSSTLNGASAGSSDQDDAMDIVSASSSSTSLHYDQGFQGQQQQRLPRTNPQQQRRSPVDSTLIQRWIAMECLASVLVDIGLELCESMAETLGCGHHPVTSALNAPISPSTSQPPVVSPSFNGFGNSNISIAPMFGAVSLPHEARSAVILPATARAAAAISSLTTFSGGGAMASGTGGVGLIYVQFVVRLVSKIIEFAGQDSSQEQRLLVLELADHEAWLDAQIRELEFANNQDCQDDNRKLAQLLSEETATMKETTASQESGSNRRMAQRIEEELKNINIKYNVISNVLQGLLLESGVDWSNDPHYLDVMLKLSQ
ncbi:hypothetical protein BGZ79_001433 [Entomortierella chlamydospora]|nr:hypothetical protein BGZ79_001433 [Entomortierella chlamydospora]